MAYDALGRGDIDRVLELTNDLLDRWPRERIQDSSGWYLLALLSQVGFDTRRFGIAAKEISRKVALTARLRELASHATGSSSRIVRALVLGEPPSVGDGEITAKGNLNARRILDRRKALLDRLYDDADPATITF